MRVACGNCRHRKEQEAGEESSGLPVTSGTRRPQVRDRLTDGSKVSIRRTSGQTQTTTHSTTAATEQMHHGFSLFSDGEEILDGFRAKSFSFGRNLF